MTTIELRSKLHALIDSFQNEELLERVYDLLARTKEVRNQGVWSTMTEDQRERVLKAYETSFDVGKLSTTDQVMKRGKA
jgi:hypothetical protein